jgi:hypothetical protein
VFAYGNFEKNEGSRRSRLSGEKKTGDKRKALELFKAFPTKS